jgi:hypothetical protein
MTNILKAMFFATMCGVYALAVATPAAAGPFSAADRDVLGLTTPVASSVHYTGHNHHHHHFCRHHHHYHHHHHRHHGY